MHGKKTGGRQKGTPNRYSGTVRENVIQVFDQLGGTTGMTAWAKENQTDFYRLYSKLLPTEITGEDGKDLIPPPADPIEVARQVAFLLESGARALQEKEKTGT